MVKKIFLFVVVAVLPLTKANSQTVTKVYDKALIRQNESMVFKVWSKSYFRPKWFYWMFYNRYRKGEDKRYIHQTNATYLASLAETKKVKESKEAMQIKFENKIADDLDRRVNLKYNLLFKDEINGLFKQIASCKIEAKVLTLDHPNKIQVVAEHLLVIEEFKHRLKVIRTSYAPSAEKNRNLEKLVDDMRSYSNYVYVISKKIDTKNYYKKIFTNTTPIKL